MKLIMPISFYFLPASELKCSELMNFNSGLNVFGIKMMLQTNINDLCEKEKLFCA